jgi:RNA recognition motif-containing protein
MYKHHISWYKESWFAERLRIRRRLFKVRSTGSSFVRLAWQATTLASFSLARKVKKRASITSHRRSTVGKKLYCGNLSYSVSSSDLEQLFAQFGSVESAQVIMERDTGRSKGFGFVEMATPAEAQAAMSGLNETEHDGRTLTVNEAKPRENRGGGGRGGYGGGRGRY